MQKPAQNMPRKRSLLYFSKNLRRSKNWKANLRDMCGFCTDGLIFPS